MLLNFCHYRKNMEDTKNDRDNEPSNVEFNHNMKMSFVEYNEVGRVESDNLSI